MQIKKEQIPWAMAAGRALLGPVIVAGEACGWSGIGLAWLVVTALASDIYDGAGVGKRATRDRRPRPASTGRARLSPIGASMLALCLFAAPAYAIGPGKVAYVNGTAAVARDTIGSFDTTSPTTLHFQYRQTNGLAGQIGIEYAKIYGIEPSEETVHPLGLLPWIAVSLVVREEKRYLVTIRYADAAGTGQVDVFEVARRDQRVIVEVVNARSMRSCGAKTYPCPAGLERR